MGTGTFSARHFVAGLFATMHVAAFLFLFARVPLLPNWAYADPVPSTILLPGGAVQFNMCHDCGPGFVLAGRGFGWSMPGNDRFSQALLLANLPSEVAAEILGSMVEQSLGQYGKMWLATCSFAITSVAQWWALGWMLGRVFNKQVAPRTALPSGHS